MTTDAQPTRVPKVVAALAGLALCAIAVFLIWRNLGDDSGSTDGPGGTESTVTTVDLPEPEPSAVSATAEYLAGDGAAILVVHDEASRLAAEGDEALTPEQCAEVVDTLDAEAPADTLVGLIGEVPDEVLGAAFESERVALGTTLTACVSDDGPEPLSVRLETLDDSSRLVEQRLDELGVTP